MASYLEVNIYSTALIGYGVYWQMKGTIADRTNKIVSYNSVCQFKVQYVLYTFYLTRASIEI